MQILPGQYTGQGASGDLKLTREQQAILNSSGNIKINAVAGSGKTTTIIQYAASRPRNSRILYLAFNKSVRLEAKKRFSDLGLHNVHVETAHSLAYKHIVMRKGYTVCQKDYKTYEIAEKLGLKGHGEKHGAYILANHISKFIAYFCNSNVEKVQELNYQDLVTDENAKIFVLQFYQHIERGTRLLLSKMYNGEVEITHDFYLKLFQLSKPQLPYDYILFDEGQDASPAMLDIFLRQKAIKVIVGDTHQQIYSWRHAINSLGTVDFVNYHLSTSFRFHQDIAQLSTEILSWKRYLQEFDPISIKGKGKPAELNSKATIARTNLGLLLRAIKFITENRNVKHLYFEGNLNSYTYADEGASLYDVLNLFNSKHDRIRDKLIGSMGNLEELEEYIEKTEDAQLGMMVEIVKEYENEIPVLLQSLKNKHVGDEDKAKAEMIFSTVHRSKGMEYDSVELVNDFVTEAKLERITAEKKTQEGGNVAKWNEEINLLYVAVTRTKGLLRIPETLVPKEFPKSSYVHIIKVKKEKDIDETFDQDVPLQASFRKKTSHHYHELNNTSTYTEKRFAHKNASDRWTTDADEQLKKMFYKNIKITSIAKHFDCKPGAILLRLKKIGCVPSEE